MKKFVLISCFLGSIFLILGGVLAFPSLSQTIRSYGTIAYHPEESQSEEEDYQTQLDQIAYLTIFVSISFFIVAFLYNRKSTVLLF